MRSTFATAFIIVIGLAAMLPDHTLALDLTPKPLPEEEIAKFLAEQNFPQLPVAGKCRWSTDRRSVWESWSSRALVKPFEARIYGSKVPQEKSVAFIRRALAQHFDLPSRDAKLTMRALDEQGRELEKAGLRDPLFSWLYGWSKYKATRDYTPCRALLEEVVQPEAVKIVGPYLRYQGLLTLADVREDASLKKDPDLDANLFAVGLAMLSQPGLFEKGEDEVLLENLRPLWSRVSDNLERMKLLVDHPWESEWLRLMMNGRYEDALGWSKRGTGWASEVTKEGWEGFEEHISNARESYYSAWRLEPKRPQSAAELIGVMMVGKGEDLGDARTWLDRTLQLEGDFYPALSAYMGSCRPRWGGSHQQMLAFALACAQTKRYDSNLPWFFNVVIRRILDDDIEGAKLLNHPLVKPVLLELCRQRVREAGNDEMRADACSELAFMAWVCEEYALSAEAFKEASPGWSPQAKRWLRYFDQRADTVRGEAVLYAAGLKEAWQQVKGAYDNHDLDGTLRLGERLLSQTQGDGATAVGRLMEAAKFERELKDGAWVKMKVSPGLLNWRIHKGIWEAAEDGALLLKGQGDSAFILYNGVVGNKFEMKGRFAVKSLPRQSCGLGVVTCQGWNNGKESWITCLQQDSGKKSQAWILYGYFQTSIPAKPLDVGAKAGTFKVVLKGDRMTYILNDKPVFEDVQPGRANRPDRLLEMLPDGRVGFCHYHFQADTETRIYDLEVRKLP